MVTTETWVPPASRQASTSALRPPAPPGEAPRSPRRSPRPAYRGGSRAHAAASRRRWRGCRRRRRRSRPRALRLARTRRRRIRQARSGRPRRLRHECGPVDRVEAAREVDDRFSEQSAEQPDLLLLPGAAGTEVLPEGLVLDVVPADSNAQAQPAPDSRSTSAACRATSPVWRCGRTRTPVAKRIRSVIPARWANITSGSWNGSYWV
jgi:hypothetical protein